MKVTVGFLFVSALGHFFVNSHPQWLNEAAALEECDVDAAAAKCPESTWRHHHDLRDDSAFDVASGPRNSIPDELLHRHGAEDDDDVPASIKIRKRAFLANISGYSQWSYWLDRTSEDIISKAEKQTRMNNITSFLIRRSFQPMGRFVWGSQGEVGAVEPDWINLGILQTFHQLRTPLSPTSSFVLERTKAQRYAFVYLVDSVPPMTWETRPTIRPALVTGNLSEIRLYPYPIPMFKADNIDNSTFFPYTAVFFNLLESMLGETVSLRFVTSDVSMPVPPSPIKVFFALLSREKKW
ncbi:MAG: hypothetical protein M1825_004401 [Sarcosagium campestre]|nr:MAG: hypothetical protein M1825_004401 [Sarcosagium campestre]